MSAAETTATYGTAETVLKLLAERKLPATPENYRLFYHYATQTDQDLVRAVDRIIVGEEAASEEMLLDMHERFFGANELNATLQAAGAKVDAEMAKLLASLEQAGADTTAYGQVLDGVSGELARTDPNEAQPIKNLVAKLLQDTERMQARSRELEARVQESSEEIRSLRDSLETTRAASLTDQLTGIPNRKAFDERLSAAAADAVESGDPMSLILCDIDHFKAFNDTFGHQTGDQVLRLVARSLKENVKGRDLPARYGGEEFAIVLPRTDLNAAKTVAEQIRFAVQSKRLVKKATNENLGSITLSLGCAQLAAGDQIADLIRRADACLYAAKRAGRNRVMAEDEVDPGSVLAGGPSAQQPVLPDKARAALAAAG